MSKTAPHFRLQQLLRLRKQETTQAEHKLGKLNQETLRRRVDITRLSKELDALNAAGHNGGPMRTPAHYHAESRYAGFLQQRIDAEIAQLAELNAQLVDARQEFINRRAEWESLERLRENHEHAQRLKLQKQSQLNMDDLVLAARHPSDTTNK